MKLPRRFRPEYWQEENRLTVLRGWARAGYGDRQIAELMAISVKQLETAKKEYPKIAAALNESKESVDYAVEEALFKRAIGFFTEVKKYAKVKITEYDANGKKAVEREEMQAYVESEYTPPDLKAQLVWLKSRCPDRWSDADAPDEEAGQCGVVILPEVSADG